MRFRKDRRPAAADPSEPLSPAVGTVECGRCHQSVPLAEAMFLVWPDGDDMWVCVRCVAVVLTFHEDAVITGPIVADNGQ